MCPKILHRGSLGLFCADCLRAQGRLARAQRVELETKRREEAKARTQANLVEHQTRLAEGTATDADKLKDENLELRDKLRVSRQLLDTYRSKTRVEDALLKNVIEFIEKNPYKPVLGAKPKVKPAGAHEMLALVSDAHYPERVDPAAMFGIGYTGDIAIKRIKHLRDTVIRYKDLRATSYPTNKLTVGVIGDMLSGDIHEELEVSNEKPIGESMVEMAYVLYDMGLSFAEEFPSVEFVIMPGNHPRTTMKPRFKNKWNNWEWVMGKMLEALSNGRFTVTVPKELIYTHDIFGYKIGMTHGDGVKVQSFAGIPFYSLDRRRNALQSLLKSVNKPQLDLICYGHFHTLIYEEGQGCGVVINGSIKGPDEYVVSNMYRGQFPVQALLTFHPKHGLTDLSRINLGHIGVAHGTE